MIRRRREPGERPPQDHSYRCSTCGLNYPNPGQCHVCKGALALIANAPPTEDLEYMIALMQGQDVPADDRVYGWRMRVLVFAGAPINLAEKIAFDRSIDLHRAEHVVREAGPELAERILL